MKDGHKAEGHHYGASRIMTSIMVFVFGSFLLVYGLGQYLWPPNFTPPLPKNLSTLEPALAKRIKECTDAINAQPNTPKPYGELGIVYEAHEYDSLAMTCYERAIDLNETEPRWIYHFALLSLKQGDYESAEKALRRVIALTPDYAPAHERLGLLLFDQRDHDGARQCFRRVLWFRPKEPHGYIGLARIQLFQLDYVGALELLIDAVKIAPYNKMVHYLLGRVYRLLGRRDEAEREFILGGNAKSTYLKDPWRNSVLQAQVTFDAKLAAAMILLERGHVSEAVTMFEQLLNQDPNDLKVLNNLAIAYFRMKRMDDARRILTLALQENPNYFQTHINLALVLLARGDLSVALEHAEWVTREAPAVNAGFQMKGLVLAKLERSEEALVSFRQAQQLNPQNRNIYGFIAQTLVKLQRWDEAIEAFKKAIEFNPQSGILHFKIGMIYSQNGQFDKAVQAFRAALIINPNNQGIVRALEIAEKQRAGH